MNFLADVIYTLILSVGQSATKIHSDYNLIFNVHAHCAETLISIVFFPPEKLKNKVMVAVYQSERKAWGYTTVDEEHCKFPEQ